MESILFQALRTFKGANGSENNLDKGFEKIAKSAFFSGCFLNNGNGEDAYKLKLTHIEFYYHEDEGSIKDNKKYLKGKNEFGYAMGAICPNPSGVDVLFDDPEKKYHASFLIRGYQAIVAGEEVWENNKKNKDGAPHDFWYDFFGGANMLNTGKFSIEWIEEEENTSDGIMPMRRININDNRLWGFKRIKLI